MYLDVAVHPLVGIVHGVAAHEKEVGAVRSPLSPAPGQHALDPLIHILQNRSPLPGDLQWSDLALSVL